MSTQHSAPATGVIGEYEPQPAVSLTLRNASTEVTVSGKGAAIDSLKVDGAQVLTTYDGRPHGLPYLDTMHSMLPFSDNFGPKHGSSRHLNYRVVGATGDRLAMCSTDPLTGMDHMQEVALLQNGIEIIDHVVADYDEQTSFGKHPYFKLDHTQISQAQIVGPGSHNATINAIRSDGQRVNATLAELLQQQYLLGDSEEPQTFMLELPQGNIRLALPGAAIDMQVSAQVTDSQDHIQRVPVNFFLWHRPGSDTFCIEPVAGAYIQLGNGKLVKNDLSLQEGSRLEFKTKITKASL